MVVPVRKGHLIINVFLAKKNLSHADAKSESPSSLSALTEALYVMTSIDPKQPLFQSSLSPLIDTTRVTREVTL